MAGHDSAFVRSYILKTPRVEAPNVDLVAAAAAASPSDPRSRSASSETEDAERAVKRLMEPLAETAVPASLLKNLVLLLLTSGDMGVQAQVGQWLPESLLCILTPLASGC